MMDWKNNYYQLTGSKRALKLTQLTGGVVILPRFNNQFLLLEHLRVDGQVHYEVPRGFTELNEKFTLAAHRELNEELNLRPAKLTFLGEVMPDSGLIESHIRCYLADLGSLNGLVVQRSEQITGYKLFSLSELLILVRNNQIIDGFTLSTVLKYLAIKDED